MKNTEIASLILTLIAHDDAQTARELAAATGLTTAALRPALRQLVGDGAVVTSGRAGATRYVLAVEEQVAQLVELVVTAAVAGQLAERSSSASLVLADEQAEEQLPACVVAMQCLCAGHAAGLPADAACDTSERWFVAPEQPVGIRRSRRARKSRSARPVIPATVDLLGGLERTAERLSGGATLQELTAERLAAAAS